MPGCVLRASGADFKVEQFLKESALSPSAVFKKGERKYRSSRSRNRWPGCNIVVSEAGGDEIELQFKDAIAFVKKHKAEINKLSDAFGAESISLDFGVDLRVGYDESFWPQVHIPKEIIRLAGALGIEIVISFYPDIKI